MAVKKTLEKENFISNYIEKNIFLSIISTFVGGFTISTTFWWFFFTNKIEDSQIRYDDKIENLKTYYQSQIDIEVIRARQEERDKGSLTIDEKSKLGILFKETIAKINKENEK